VLTPDKTADCSPRPSPVKGTDRPTRSGSHRLPSGRTMGWPAKPQRRRTSSVATTRGPARDRTTRVTRPPPAGPFGGALGGAASAQTGSLSQTRLILKTCPHRSLFRDHILKTGNGRQGHSWVRIPPPPLKLPRSCMVELCSVGWRVGDVRPVGEGAAGGGMTRGLAGRVVPLFRSVSHRPSYLGAVVTS